MRQVRCSITVILSFNRSDDFGQTCTLIVYRMEWNVNVMVCWVLPLPPQIQECLVVHYRQLSGCFRLFVQKIWEWRGPMNGILLDLFCECSLNSYDTHRWWGYSNPTCCNKIWFELFALITGTQACSRPRSLLVKLS